MGRVQTFVEILNTTDFAFEGKKARGRQSAKTNCPLLNQPSMLMKNSFIPFLAKCKGSDQGFHTRRIVNFAGEFSTCSEYLFLRFKLYGKSFRKQ